MPPDPPGGSRLRCSQKLPVPLKVARVKFNSCFHTSLVSRPEVYLKFTSDVNRSNCSVSIICTNIIYCITCTLCNKLYIGESGRELGDHFREYLLDVKNKGSDLSKPVARHFNLPGHSHEHMKICGIYLHLGNNETRKRKEQRLIFKLGTLAPNGINERFSFA